MTVLKFKSVEEAVSNDFRQEMETIIEAVIGGGLSHEEYLRKTGELRGLQCAQAIFNEWVEKARDQ